MILSEVYDLRRFAAASEFMAFLGFVPSEHSSGQKQRRGGITKTGNSRVRRVRCEFERRFTADRMAREYVNLYEVVCGR